MKANEITISATVREADHYKSVISQILLVYNGTYLFKSSKKADRPHKTNAGEDRKMQRLSMENLFNAAAGIACHSSAARDEPLI